MSLFVDWSARGPVSLLGGAAIGVWLVWGLVSLLSKLAGVFVFLKAVAVTLLRALKARRWREGSTTRKVDWSYGKPVMTRGVVSPKVDVQAWPLSNTTVQEELL